MSHHSDPRSLGFAAHHIIVYMMVQLVMSSLHAEDVEYASVE